MFDSEVVLDVVIFPCVTVRGKKKREGFTFADEQYVVVAEAHWTFTAEAPDLIDTHSTGTDARDFPALVNI